MTLQAGFVYTMYFNLDPRLMILWGFIIYVGLAAIQLRGGAVLWVSFHSLPPRT
jgi:hypothetical protein